VSNVTYWRQCRYKCTCKVCSKFGKSFSSFARNLSRIELIRRLPYAVYSLSYFHNDHVRFPYAVWSLSYFHNDYVLLPYAVWSLSYVHDVHVQRPYAVCSLSYVHDVHVRLPYDVCSLFYFYFVCFSCRETRTDTPRSPTCWSPPCLHATSALVSKHGKGALACGLMSSVVPHNIISTSMFLQPPVP
jgi:hypothetical protein